VFLSSNGAISWQSRKQSLTAMSSLEAKFITCSEASREAKWSLQLQKDIHSSKKDSPLLPINCDNHGALALITTGIINAGTKHIDVCFHNSRDLHRRRIVNYSYLHANENVADILTKALTKDKHENSQRRWGYGNRGRFKVGLKVVSPFFWARGFPCLSMDSHPQAMVVLLPCSLATQGLKEATMGITVCLLLCLFSCSTEHSKRGECCIYGLSPWRMASVV